MSPRQKKKRPSPPKKPPKGMVDVAEDLAKFFEDLDAAEHAVEEHEDGPPETAGKRRG